MFRILLSIIMLMIGYYLTSLFVMLMNFPDTLALCCGILGVIVTVHITLLSVYKLLIKN